MLMKTAISVAFEAVGLLAVLKGAQLLSAQSIPVLSTTIVGGLPVVEWMSLFIVIFNAPFVKDIIAGGISTAGIQIMRPDKFPGDSDWNEKLAKPWFYLPGWVFAVMWVLVSKPTQLWAVSRLLVAASAESESDSSEADGEVPWHELAVYCVHLALGDGWNDVYMGAKRLGLGLVIIVVQYATLVRSYLLFREVDPEAGKFLLPTLGWMAVAVALNEEVYRLNPSKKEKK